MYRSDQILFLFREDKEKAFKLLFDTYYDSLLVFANSILENSAAAEDVIQDCFVDFWVHKRFEKLDGGVDKYLFQTVKHASLNYLRGEERRQNRQMDFVAETEDIDREGKDEWDVLGRIYALINELAEDRRRIFMLICMDGMKYQDVDNILNISINTVKKQMARAFKFLRESMSSAELLLLLLLLFKKRLFVCHTK